MIDSTEYKSCIIISKRYGIYTPEKKFLYENWWTPGLRVHLFSLFMEKVSFQVCSSMSVSVFSDSFSDC